MREFYLIKGICMIPQIFSIFIEHFHICLLYVNVTMGGEKVNFCMKYK